MTSDITPVTSRRQAIKAGGLSLGLAALVAACGENRGGDPGLGRVGNADVVEPLPTYEVDDVVLLRTASSLEFTAVEVYETLLAMDGVVPDGLVSLVERMIEDHQETADVMVQLTEQAGGEPWLCTNAWFMDRLVGTALELIQSNVVGFVRADDNGDPTMVQVIGDTVPIADTVTTVQGELTLLSDPAGVSVDDPLEFSRLDGAVTDDVVAFAQALETLASASHQELASNIGFDEARTAHLEAALLEARHSAVMAIRIGGEARYISPAVIGEDVTPTERGQIRHFAIESTFGSTAQIEVKAGPANENAVRESLILQTPAANSLVYREYDDCQA